MSDIYSFYQLISKYQIEIPIIQRDYAQGRKNSKAADVRKSLVENMIMAVKGDKSLFFDFVYGRVDNNKFIPFDGQQRLTTLFLFHKYVFEKCQSDSGCNHEDNCSCGGILGRFSYATRQSSREFCKKLVENNIIPDDKYKNQLRETFIAALKKEDNEKEKKADEFIKSIDNWIYRFETNQPWFYPDWEKDPTVIGMLTMLDEIHCQMEKNETDFKKFAEKLTSGCNCPITFHFVDMGEHKMSDETYVKMNARGKTLTPFENFKASLEQYLEEKSKSENLSVELQGKCRVLLCRLKGEYDEALQKYTGIDGTWLDLFWKVANKDKKEKDLPDTIMMSFFNRHFMNVWRCWYANSSKSEKKEEYDAFNTRIQEEMPLYPTKDDFVPFDIYEYVINKCGIEDCLSPIFNIWDALCEKDNSILSYCQAVWNRKEKEPKWNLFFGDKNKDNRETYPSRVAFYALMRYFTNSTDTRSLTRWMRVVWNIIENSTINSSDTYHAALRLIEKLSTKSHTIYNALANEFESLELGNQYHAQDQVAEEIAKAKQIVNNDCESCKKFGKNEKQTWEEIIIEGEKYAFFKGTIRFLFRDGTGNVDWSKFDDKWKNAQEYFDAPDQDGDVIKDTEQNKYKTDTILLRAFISKLNCIPDNDYIFDNQAETWKHILTDSNKDYIGAVNDILLGDTSVKESEKKEIARLCKDLKLFKYLTIDFKRSRKRFIHGHCALYPKGSWNGVFLDYTERDTLLHEAKDISINNNSFGDFILGWDINFIYKDNNFQWYRDGVIYMMNSNWGYIPKVSENEKTNNALEDYYCFDVKDEMDADQFTKKLDKLIESYPKE